jgi:hypothetical protein
MKMLMEKHAHLGATLIEQIFPAGDQSAGYPAPSCGINCSSCEPSAFFRYKLNLCARSVQNASLVASGLQTGDESMARSNVSRLLFSFSRS